MNCGGFEQALERARDERLPADEARDMSAHGAECLRCARLERAEARMRQGLASLRRGAEVEAPLGFAASVTRRIQAQPPQPAVAWRTAGFVGIAATVVMGALVMLGRTQATPPALSADAARPALSLPADRGVIAAPVAWSNGQVDVVESQPAPVDQPVAVLVEWNL